MAFSERLAPLNKLERFRADIGLGCAPIGGLFNSVEEDAAEATVATALSHGIRFFDTAPHYGAGLSEQRLGKALRATNRDSFSIATKVGRQIVNTDGDVVPLGTVGVRTIMDTSSDGVLRSLESSLIRLDMDRIDVVYLHDPEDVDVALATAIPAMLRLRDEGVVRSIGVGMNYSAPLVRFVKETDLDVVMVAGRYTLLDRDADAKLLTTAAENEVDVIAAGVFNSGILADPTDQANYDYRPATLDELVRARALQEKCAAYGTQLSAAALQFPLRHAAVCGVLVGARSAEEVEQIIAGAEIKIPNELWSVLLH